MAMLVDRIRNAARALTGRDPAPVCVRRFDAATGTRRGSGMSSMGRTVTETLNAGPQIMRRARGAVANNPLLAGAVANHIGQLIGPGFMPVPQHPDPDTRATLSRLWQEWTDEADTEGLTELFGMQALVALAAFVDSESFVLFEGVGPAGPLFRVLPAEMVDRSKTAELPGEGVIVAGIEFDAQGRRVAYWIFETRPHDQFESYRPSIRVDAANVMHVFERLGAGQVRGVSALAPALLAAHDLDELTDALRVGTKIAAMHAGFINNAAGGPGEGVYANEQADEDVSLEPGTVRRLGLGEDIKFNTPQHAQETSAFVAQQARTVAMGLGLPAFLFDGDLSQANYSSLRAGLLPYRAKNEAYIYNVLVPQYCAPSGVA